MKGLDRKLLERVRRGEDVLRNASAHKLQAEEMEESPAEAPGIEDAFDELANEELESIVHDRVEKKGELLDLPPPPSIIKKSRNDILKELRRQREDAARAATMEHEKKYPTLGPAFRKVNANGETTRIETDERGREVLIVTGLDGKEKRKVRKHKADQKPNPEVRHDLDDITKPINMHNLPQPAQEDSEDDDIFEGVGSNYNPLAHLDDDAEDAEDADSESDHTSINGVKTQRVAVTEHSPPEGAVALIETVVGDASTATSTTPAARRDYFKSIARDNAAIDNELQHSSADATVRAALAKVRNLDDSSTLLQNLSTKNLTDAHTHEARLKKRALELAASDRDMEDMDMGFGASRFDDAEEMERDGEKVKLSQWKGLGAEGDDDELQDGTGAKKRKRGAKKRKGDKNNPDDVLKVMERQKEKKAKTLG